MIKDRRGRRAAGGEGEGGEGGGDRRSASGERLAEMMKSSASTICACENCADALSQQIEKDIYILCEVERRICREHPHAMMTQWIPAALLDVLLIEEKRKHIKTR